MRRHGSVMETKEYIDRSASQAHTTLERNHHSIAIAGTSTSGNSDCNCWTDVLTCRRTNTDSATARFQEYQIIGRHLPSEANPTPKIYRMRIFAPNEVVAKSRFWYFLGKLRKIKKANGEIVSVNQVRCSDDMG